MEGLHLERRAAARRRQNPRQPAVAQSADQVRQPNGSTRHVRTVRLPGRQDAHRHAAGARSQQHHARGRLEGDRRDQGLQVRHPVLAVVLRHGRPAQRQPHDSHGGRQERQVHLARRLQAGPGSSPCANRRAGEEGGPRRLTAAAMLEPFIVSGLAVGSLYALSGVGMLVLYRTTGVVNMAYGALGAMAALITWQMLQNGAAEWLAYAAGVGAAGGASLLYGSLLGPYLAEREPVVKAMASLGFALAILGVLNWYWSDDTRTLSLPTDTSGFNLGDVRVSSTQLAALVLAVAITVGTAIYLRRSITGTSMRALADDRELTSVLGIRVRRVESLAWLVSGVLGGVSGLLLADLTQLTATSLTFLVIPALAACVVGRFRSLWWTLLGGVLVGVIEAIGTPYSWISDYRSAAPFVVAIAVVLYLQRHKMVTIASRAASVAAVKVAPRPWRPRTAAVSVAVLVAVGYAVPAVFSVF